VIPFRGERARGLTPSAGVSEASFRAELTTECGSTPTARSKQLRGKTFNEDVKRYSLNVKRTAGGFSANGSMRLTNNCSRLTKNAHVAQLVEHVLGKDEVTRSIRVVGSTEIVTSDG
jgi:hypothetical protein